eukprot:CAMPEP_0172535438 /NCGR_PEP_ID=MMETSP1067-20121228/7447_1 /TAXON_ID=265564 ORGANISM="Thalassiosira punctigera, Strain Tpunct2005C2" /NCGR_SAMPLE_ID=MMETSP1067 /ASSEMBLY_ACC=CAM_ASM_000444 /LENGTH=754 /DNA_ID=CAMNT_0013320371 /DNA_START=24 /DNA_END=2288 /DNA_ORIENTATION=-
MTPVQEDSASAKSKLSSSSTSKKFSSLKKRLKIFKRLKSADRGGRGTSNTGNFRSQNSNDILGKKDDQDARVAGSAPSSRRNSLLSTEDADVPCVDKFGFVVEDVLGAAGGDEAETSNCSGDAKKINNNGCSKKVGEIFPKSSASVGNDSSGPSAVMMMKKITRNGLPDHMRHRAWTLITGVDKLVMKREGEYDTLVGKSRVDMKQIQECLMGGQHRTVLGQIEKDLKRTFPNHHLFRDVSENENNSTEFVCQDHPLPGDAMEGLDKIPGKPSMKEGYGKKALRRILRAYSVYDSDMGYCKGINFIAAMFLTFLPEEESFWMLVVVMNEGPYKLRDLFFSQEMEATHEVLYIADKLVSQFLPDLYEHLENEQVHISMFVTQWLMTIFTSTAPFKLVARVWDAFLCDGWHIVYRTMLAILMYVEEELSVRDVDHILSFIRGVQSSVDCEKIFVLVSQIPLGQHHIQEYAMEFRKLTKTGEIQVEEVLLSRFGRPESTDGHSLASSRLSSSRATLANIRKVHRFVPKLIRSTREISYEDLSSKLVPIVGSSKFAVLLSNVLSPEECAGLIKRAKGEQFEDFLMRRPGVAGNDATEIANCRRSKIEDLDLASELFDRIVCALQGTELEAKLQNAPWVSEESSTGYLNATGLNDGLHFLRYGTGQFFAPHRDSRFRRGSETSHITVQVFLNHNFSGGMTSFKGGKRYLDVKPKAGSVLLFDQDLRREECEVFAGRKFIARSDVMYAYSREQKLLCTRA